MRFMMIHKADANTEGGSPPPALMEALGGLIAESMAKGQLVSSGGLMPSAMGARVSVGDGQMLVKDGPFSESKELVGGFAIIEVPSKAEAVELARRWMQIHADIMGPSYHGEAEIRQLFSQHDGA